MLVTVFQLIAIHIFSMELWYALFIVASFTAGGGNLLPCIPSNDTFFKLWMPCMQGIERLHSTCTDFVIGFCSFRNLVGVDDDAV